VHCRLVRYFSPDYSDARVLALPFVCRCVVCVFYFDGAHVLSSPDWLVQFAVHRCSFVCLFAHFLPLIYVATATFAAVYRFTDFHLLQFACLYRLTPSLIVMTLDVCATRTYARSLPRLLPFLHHLRSATLTFAAAALSFVRTVFNVAVLVTIRWICSVCCVRRVFTVCHLHAPPPFGFVCGHDYVCYATAVLC